MSTTSAGHKITGHAKAPSAGGATGATIKGVAGLGSGFTGGGEGSTSGPKTLGLKNECLKSRSPYVSSYRVYRLANSGEYVRVVDNNKMLMVDGWDGIGPWSCE